MSFRTWPRAGVVVSLGIIAAACGKDPMDPTKQVAILEIFPEEARLYSIGQQVSFSSSITTVAGTDGTDIEVSYVSRNAALVEVNAAGLATAKTKGGFTWIVATAGGVSDSSRVEVSETPCGSTSATTMTVGQVITGVGTGFCAAGGASAGEYTVILTNNSLAGSGTSAAEITAISVANPPSAGASLSMAPIRPLYRTPLRAWQRDVAAELRHRRAEAEQVAPLAEIARAWYASRSRRAALSTMPAAVGDLMRINVSLSTSCADSTMVDARVAAVSSSAIVLADPRNPTSGYNDAEYAEFAAMFDSIINPLDVANFGAPTDLDANQRVLLVFTRAINERTPPNSDFYVGGITHSRDLLPKTACAASNVAEMFYLLVPDPTGTVNGNDFSKTFVSSVTDATIAHEFQHLINFARRRYLNNPGTSQPVEALWLNEGLSHLAEELLYYRRTNTAPRTNIGAATVFATNASFNLFANYMSGDFLNYDEYVFRTTETSPFEAGDDLATRGASWAFLRYVADQLYPGSEQTLWLNLVGSGETGTQNLQNRLGIGSAALQAALRDFTVAVYADDHVPVPAKYTHPSWDMRSIYPGLQQPFLWPMAVAGLDEAEKNTIALQAGGFKVYRFRGVAGADSYISITGALGTALPSNLTATVIRTY